MFDANHDNFISRDELQTALRKLGNEPTDEDIDDMIREADKDGDGKISFEGKNFFSTYNNEIFNESIFCIYQFRFKFFALIYCMI